MKKHIAISAISLMVTISCGLAQAQLPPSGTTALLPANPTSADNLKLSMKDRTCGGINPYKPDDTYSVSMSQNNITVTLGETTGSIVPLCPPSGPREEFDIGRLPAGNFTLSVYNSNFGTSPDGFIILNSPFTVTDARVLKTAPYVRLDYSGHWWDPNDSGWGLFIWQDARDNILAAWFTYTPDGKPIWYVFQPTWETNVATATANLQQTFRAPGPTSPPPTMTGYFPVGTAKLDFANAGTTEVGKIIYTFNGGTQLTRNIQRFKP